MNSTISLQRLQFLNETYSPSEANDVITKVIDDQIKFYKLQNLKRWIKNSDCDQDSVFDKIEHLKQRKQELIEITQKAKEQGTQLNLCGDFQLTIKN